jgi:hypothetical protein
LISSCLFSLTEADVYILLLQCIVSRSENAITFSHFDYSESAEDPAKVEERKKKAADQKLRDMMNEMSSSDDESPPPSDSSSRKRKRGGTAHKVEPPSSTPQTVPKVVSRPAADASGIVTNASGIVTRQQERRRKLNMD